MAQTAIEAMEAEIIRLKREAGILCQLVGDLTEIVNAMNRQEPVNLETVERVKGLVFQALDMSEAHKAMFLADMLATGGVR